MHLAVLRERKIVGVIVDLAAASQAITRSVEKAESTSGLEITSALVSMAGAHVSSVNSRGAVAVNGNVIDPYDIAHALDQARAVAIPVSRATLEPSITKSRSFLSAISF